MDIQSPSALVQAALNSHYSRMNDMQKRAVFQMNGPLLILAGAGSGKTTVLINRIENMVLFGDAFDNDYSSRNFTSEEVAFLKNYKPSDAENTQKLSKLVGIGTLRPWNILAITFTNKAAGELRDRLESALGTQALDIQASTFHSLCVRILRREISALGYNSSFTIYDTDDSLRVIKAGLRSCNLDEKMFAPRACLNAISRAKDYMQTPQEMADEAKHDYRLAGISRVYDYYQTTLKDANALDFDDIILLTVRLFQQFPQILENYQNRYRYIMVDEYQDTNHTQYLLVSMLAAKHRNICVVGDDDQSIYKFRGATIENILSFEEQFTGANVIRLEQNYRSTQNILSAANKVIENNTARKGKNLWTEAGEGEKINLVRLRDELEESRFIADTITENVEQGAKYSDHAILYRMNAQSNAVERSLANHAIPYRIIGGLRFYERKEIKDMVAYMSVINNPSDSLRLQRIINEPKRGIGGTTVTAVEEIAYVQKTSMFNILVSADQYEALGRKRAPLIEFAQLMKKLQQSAEEKPLDQLLDEILDKSGYRMMLESQGFEGAGRLENIMELKSSMVNYANETEEPTLSGFLEEIALYTDLDTYDLNADSVVLMTAHSAKGLEFDNVFIVGMDEGIFPSKSSINMPEEIEEERRLAYVAITRAKRKLHITTAQRRLMFGQTMWGRPSRFMSEIPDELVNDDDRTRSASDTSGDKKPQYSHAGSTASSTSIGVGASNSKQSEKIAAGDSVQHKVFGVGKVLTARPMAGDTLLEIDFESVGIKKIMANFARLILINE